MALFVLATGMWLSMGLGWALWGSGKGVHAADRFDRQVAGRWGSAETGGAYVTRGGDGTISVDGSVGTMRLPARGSFKAVLLPAVTARDIDIRVRIATDKRPVGGRQFVYLEARAREDEAYRPKLVLAPSGSIVVHAGRVIDGRETELGRAVTVNGLRQGSGEYMWLQARVVGADPTQILVRAWGDGQPEPAGWQYTASDATPALQEPGSVGLRAYLGAQATNPPITLSFDDLLVTPADPTAPTGSPVTDPGTAPAGPPGTDRPDGS